jgi:Domain of unknown function (DUF4185)
VKRNNLDFEMLIKIHTAASLFHWLARKMLQRKRGSSSPRLRLWPWLASMALLLFIARDLSAASAPAGRAALEWDALFQRESGWTGADGNFSIPLSTNRTLWLFGDTWIGRIRNSKRIDATMVNNSVAIQYGHERPEFFYGATNTGKPTAFITPKDRYSYFWPFHGARTRDRLYLFLQQVESVPSESAGPFSFRIAATWLGCVRNPDEAPPNWKITLEKIPFSQFGSRESLLLGSFVLRDGDYFYIYGQNLRLVQGKSQRSLVAARVQAEQLGNFKEWRFYADGTWQSNPAKLSPLCPDFPTEFSITYLPALKKYAAIYVEGAISGKIILRLSESPIGPWDGPTLIYECPEQKWPEKVFCYSAKAHPELAAAPGELIITYAANSWEFGNLSDARLYWPRFVRVNFGSKDADEASGTGK